MVKVSKVRRPSRKRICRIDQEILRVLATDRFASRRELHDRLSEKPDFYRLRRRIRYLQKIGLVEPLVGDATNRLGYRLTNYGRVVALRGEMASKPILQSRPAFKSQFDHDQVVNEMRDILIASGIISNFVSEAELRSQIAASTVHGPETQSHDWKVPDGMFSLVTKLGVSKVALEVELTQKAKARYAKIVQALLTTKQFNFVFFVCGSEKLEKLLSDAVASARSSNAYVKASDRSNGIYFCQLDKLRELRLNAPWCGESRTFTINDLMTGKA